MAVRPLAAAFAGLSAFLALSLGACQDSAMLGGASTRSITPIPAPTLALMQTKGMSQADPILIRAFKKEAEMEVWKRGSDGQYALLKTFPICRWSGQLGPKTKQGDRQAPEGFYTITPGQMNPNSSYYLSFDVGYPNQFDRANGRTGNYIMVHGTCSSSGCFAMTDASMSEIYAIAREAFAGGQRAFQFQSYPYRMTAANVARFRNDPHAPFWKNLKEGSDHFEALKEEPRVGVCGTRYVFGGADAASGSCTPRVDPLVAEKRDRDAQQVADLIAKGTPATRVVYDDGGQNPVFRPQPQSNFASLSVDSEKDKDLAYTAKEFGRYHVGEISRPESLAAGPQEFEIDGKGRPVLIAAAAPGPTKAAAAALDKGSGGKAAAQTARPAAVAALADPQNTGALSNAGASKPGRVTVADADGDSSAYQKVLGGILGRSAEKDRQASAPVAAPTTEPPPASQTIAANHVARAREKTKDAPKAESAAKTATPAKPEKTGMTEKTAPSAKTSPKG